MLTDTLISHELSISFTRNLCCRATVLFHSMLGISFIMYTATYIGRKCKFFLTWMQLGVSFALDGISQMCSFCLFSVLQTPRSSTSVKSRRLPFMNTVKSTESTSTIKRYEWIFPLKLVT